MSPTRVPRRPVPRPARAALAALAVVAVVLAGAAGTALTRATAAAAAASGPALLTAGRSLAAGAALVSPDGTYRLALQGDGNLVLSAPHRVQWATFTDGQVAGGPPHLSLQTDGNLVLYRGDGVPLWYTATSTGSRLVLQDDGNLVLYDARGAALWSSRTPTDVLHAGESIARGETVDSDDRRYRLALQTDGNLVLYGPAGVLWTTATTTGSHLDLQGDGNLVLYTAGGTPLWWSGTGPATSAVVEGGAVRLLAPTGQVGRVPAPPDALEPGQTLPAGDELRSPDGRYRLAMQTDGNIVLYGPDGPSWWSITSLPDAVGLTAQTDGNLVGYSRRGPFWATGTNVGRPARLVLQDDGHLVLTVGGVPAWSVWARSAGVDAAVGAAAAFGAAQGERTAVAVLDRTTGLVYTAGDADAPYASASVMKTFIAARLLSEGAQADPSTAALMWRMITLSDDAAATALWSRAGGPAVTDWVRDRYGIGGLSGPTIAGYWGTTQITARAMVSFYGAVADDPAVGPWLMNAMAAAAPTAADGWGQWFGIPSATTGWRVKQGWMCCLDARSRLHTTGFVGADRYTVAILTDGSTGYYGQRGADVVTGAAQRLLPGGRMPQ